MDELVARCAGLDVHQASVMACVLVDEGKRRKVIEKFAAVGPDLRRLRDWLLERRVTHVAMEGTGIYWRPVYAVLEGHFDLTVANAQHIRNVPGRKTDVSDAEWIANLLRHGLIRKSFIPAKDIRELRDLTRYRRTLVHDRSTGRNRLIKLLESSGIKLASVASDVFGASGMAMLHAIIEGTKNPVEVAALARGRLRSKQRELALALDTIVEPQHRLVLKLQMMRLSETDAYIAEMDKLIDAKASPYTKQLELLKTIIGIADVAAVEIFAEIGPDLGSFPTDAHFASWAGLCPGMHESAGKHHSGRRRRGNPYLQSILVEAAYAASRKKGSYLRAKFHRLRARRGGLRALFAIAHKIGRAVYRVLVDKVPYQDLGDSYLDKRDRQRIGNQLIDRLVTLGYTAEEILRRLPRVDQPEESRA